MKIDPRAKAEIKGIAETLFPFKRTYLRKTTVSGSALIEGGHFKIEGNVIDPNQSYVLTKLCAYEVNHQKELLKAYKRGGGPGVASYIKNLTVEIQKRKGSIIAP